jgi:putative Holliday junction resolvase
LDVGERRIGLAISDASQTLARPVGVVAVASLGAAAVTAVIAEIARQMEADEVIGGVVVGLPRRLDGSPNAFTPRVETFAATLHATTGYPVHLQDERLTSREAESRLARREKNWRARKARLDAAAAAIILQDYLDLRSPAVMPHDFDRDADS